MNKDVKNQNEDPYRPKLPPRVRKVGEGHQYISPMDGVPKMNKQLKSFNNNAPTDLTSQLAQKLRLVNEENENYKILLRRANEENRKLREQLEVSSLGQQGSSNAQLQEYKQLISEQQAYIRVLEKQVSNLESFLDSHGLAYIESDSESLPPPRDELERQNAEIRKQIDELKNESFKPPQKEDLDTQIRKLNQLAGARVQYGRKQDNTYGFADREAIKVRFYKDGIYVNKGPFRPYEHDSVQRFMNDIMHGYLPSEWQDIYPEGVQIQAYYELDKEFVGESKTNDFSGKAEAISQIPSVPYPEECAPGQQKGNNYLDKHISTNDDEIKRQTELDRQKIRGDLKFGVADNSNIVNAMDDKQQQFRKMNVQEFLQKIPDKKILKGKIINVREQVAKDLGVGKKEQMVDLGKTIIIERPDEAEIKRATLRIIINAPGTKFHDKNIVVKVKLETPMSKVYEDIAQVMGAVPNQLKIQKMTGMVLENCERTVEEYGITHNIRAFCAVSGALQ